MRLGGSLMGGRYISLDLEKSLVASRSCCARARACCVRSLISVCTADHVFEFSLYLQLRIQSEHEKVLIQYDLACTSKINEYHECESELKLSCRLKGLNKRCSYLLAPKHVRSTETLLD